MTIMMKLKNRYAALVAASVFLVTTAGAQVEFGPISGDADKGKQAYNDYGCFGCHGYAGIGRHNLANDVSGIMFNETVYLTFLRARADQNPLFPTQSMPNYPAESLSVPSIANRYQVSRQHVQVTVNSLLDKGLVVTRDNPRHKRSPLIALEPKGRALFARVLEQDQRELDRLLAGVPVSDLRTTQRTLNSLLEELS